MYECGEEEVEAARRVLLSKNLFRYQSGHQGECDLFEREFAAHIGAGHSILLNSGTNALVAALRAYGIGADDEVIVPAYTFVATPAAVRLVGATPVIANIDASLGLDVHDARKKITSRTRAIIPVHMDGLAADMNGIMALAQEFGLFVIEDCAQAIGGSYKGRRLGSIGHAGAFSLNVNKIISCGEGGIVATSDRTKYETMFCIHDLSAIYSPVKKDLLQNVEPFLGSSMRVSELLGAVARVQLGRLDEILAKLRERKQRLIHTLQDAAEVRIVSGHCADGDCGTSLHFKFSDPAAAAFGSKLLDKAGIVAAPPTLRPAHVAWKWIDLVHPKAEAAAAKGDLLPSMDIILSTLKYDIDPNLDLNETDRLAQKFLQTIQLRA
jgi:8-amino-3,8-dideoxy-alpha-D-manno-octulosonate transaminase